MNRSTKLEAFYASWKWRKCKKAFAKSKGNICERCLAHGIIEAGNKEHPLEAHHKIPLTDENVDNPKISLNWDNLELLCSGCHHNEHDRREKRRWEIGPDGHVIL